MPVYPTEEQEQIALVRYLDILMAQKKVVIYSATPNNLWTRSWQQKLKMKRLGQKQGYPDLTVVLPQKLLFIELKRKGKHTVSPEQKTWIEALQRVSGNVSAKVCVGCDAAIEFINKHLQPETPTSDPDHGGGSPPAALRA